MGRAPEREAGRRRVLKGEHDGRERWLWRKRKLQQVEVVREGGEQVKVEVVKKRALARKEKIAVKEDVGLRVGGADQGGTPP